MTSPAKKSLLAKLRNQSRKRGLPSQLMLLFYMQEGFLARVTKSRYRDSLILKGGLNLYSRYQSTARPTRDIDLAGQNISHTVEGVTQVIQEIAQSELADGIIFDTESLKAEEILEGGKYGGIRINLQARFDDAAESLQLDISFGNAITPSPVELSFPSLLGESSHLLRGYSVETIVAEKIAAAVEIGAANTRLKDFYDVYQILENEPLDSKIQKDAFIHTFKARGTPSNRLQILKSLDNAQTQLAWKNFLNANSI